MRPGTVLGEGATFGYPPARVWGTALDEETAALIRDCQLGSAVLFADNIGTPEETRARIAETMLRHARTIVSCTASSASEPDPSIR